MSDFWKDRSARQLDRIAGKIFTHEENQEYHVSPIKSNYLASRFSLKEAAYKYCFKIDRKRFFNPKALKVTAVFASGIFLIDTSAGWLIGRQSEYHDHFYTEVAGSMKDLNGVKSKKIEFRSESRELSSQNLRADLQWHLQEKLRQPITISYTDSNIPQVELMDEHVSIDISLTYAGRFAAWSYLLINN